MSKIKWIVASVFLSVWAPVTVADETITREFDALDNDGDGFIDRSEATARADLRQHWNNVDKNQDGRLSVEEFTNFARVPKEPIPIDAQ